MFLIPLFQIVNPYLWIEGHQCFYQNWTIYKMALEMCSVNNGSVCSLIIHMFLTSLCYTLYITMFIFTAFFRMMIIYTSRTIKLLFYDYVYLRIVYSRNQKKKSKELENPNACNATLTCTY